MNLKKSISGIDTGPDLLSLIENGSGDAFTEFYSDNFKKLILVSEKYVGDVYVAEEIVQNIFLRIWEDKSILMNIKSIRSYLYRSVVNASINHVNRERNIVKHHAKIAENLSEEDIEALDEQNQLIALLYDEIELLPDKCRQVFKMSRLEGLKYRDIASKLAISEKTVENHMGNALKILRTRVISKVSHESASSGRRYYSLLILFLY
jgi:RNA polymerase sigma-70 factor (family 1)